MRALPDITSNLNATHPTTLQWVGMENVAVPILLRLQNEELTSVAAKANVFVNLKDVDQRGIHMSRLHTTINRLANTECNQTAIQNLLNEMIDSQKGSAQEAKIVLKFNVTLQKPALLSDRYGYQSYPVIVSVEKRKTEFTNRIELSIPYSSTCPCSTSLAQQLYADAVEKAFSDTTINKTELLDWIQSSNNPIATPHSQRSYAHISLSTGNGDWPALPALVFKLEEIIGTPVQTAVKRIDEQEFARINAENLLFCEDAARRIKFGLNKMPHVEDFWFKVEHKESLHAHNAVVIDQKFDSANSK